MFSNSQEDAQKESKSKSQLNSSTWGKLNFKINNLDVVEAQAKWRIFDILNLSTNNSKIKETYSRIWHEHLPEHPFNILTRMYSWLWIIIDNLNSQSKSLYGNSEWKSNLYLYK